MYWSYVAALACFGLSVLIIMFHKRASPLGLVALGLFFWLLPTVVHGA